jgi:endonuclease YncB( thermonuclease family)
MLIGIPIVIGGDTIRIANTRVRLYGINVPEVK